jgi:protein-disulfide isomerase
MLTAQPWIPAFAGMTDTIGKKVGLCRRLTTRHSTKGTFLEDIVTRIFRSSIVGLLALLASGLVGAYATEDKAWPIDEVLGKPDAPITIIEYASLGCPHCALFHNAVFPKVKAEWVDTGKAKFIFRDYPLNPPAQAAALIAHCSGERYFKFVDYFFQSQQQWGAAPQPVVALKNIALIGGFSSEEVDKCLADKTLFQQLSDRQQDAQKRYDVTSTPTFIINGKSYPGALSYEEFSAILTKLK